LIRNSYIVYQELMYKTRGLIIPKTIILNLHTSPSQLKPTPYIHHTWRQPRSLRFSFFFEGTVSHCLYNIHAIVLDNNLQNLKQKGYFIRRTTTRLSECCRSRASTGLSEFSPAWLSSALARLGKASIGKNLAWPKLRSPLKWHSDNGLCVCRFAHVLDIRVAKNIVCHEPALELVITFSPFPSS